jgi:DNA-directed RNA polymerase specialized sigma24 family protein
METTMPLGPRHSETTSDPDLGRLMEAFLRKDFSAAQELYGRFAGRIFGIGMVILRNRSQAEALVQDTFVNLWRKGMAFDPKRGSLDTWVMLIACRLAIEIHHRRGPETRVVVSELVPSGRNGSRDIAEEESLARAPQVNGHPLTLIGRRRGE